LINLDKTKMTLTYATFINYRCKEKQRRFVQRHLVSPNDACDVRTPSIVRHFDEGRKHDLDGLAEQLLARPAQLSPSCPSCPPLFRLLCRHFVLGHLVSTTARVCLPRLKFHFFNSILKFQKYFNYTRTHTKGKWARGWKWALMLANCDPQNYLGCFSNTPRAKFLAT